MKAGPALVLLSMTEDVIHLRNQAKRCRRLAESVSTEQDQALLRREASDFDEAADKLEKKRE
jgi:hypothetical protein